MNEASLSKSPINVARYLETEKWIARFTLAIGVVAAVPVGWIYGLAWGGGILAGAVLAWLNFRWLKQGLDALMAAATAQAEQRKARVPVGTYFKAAFRYGLIGLAVYVIFKYLNVPVLSMILGMCALGAATLGVSVYEILGPQEK